MPTRPIPEKFLVAFSFAGEQRDLVSSIAEGVEQKLGLGNVFYDEWFEYYIAGQNADIRLQNVYSQLSVLVVLCISEHYGGKPWTLAEYTAIRDLQLTTSASTEKQAQFRILPVRVGDGNVPGIFINTIVPDAREKSIDENVQLILDRLQLIDPLVTKSTAVPTATPTPPGPVWPESPPELDWPLADHTPAREAFGNLIVRNPTWRYLPVRGQSETGKSHVTKQMLANALRLPDLACGRFDFKGTTDMDAEVRTFVQDLNVPLPPLNSRLNDRLTCILDELKKRAEPALLIFDTYEVAGESRDWVEKQLLPSLIRASWLRVVIAGQTVPNSVGAIWRAIAPKPLELKPPPPADWLAYGKNHRPNLQFTLEAVENICNLAENKASLLAQLFGPTT
jgi:hypothetical protein